MNINELEGLIFTDKQLQTKENYLALFDHYYSIYQTSSPKDKYKQRDKLEDFIYQAYKKGNNTVEDLAKYIDILRQLNANQQHLSQIIGKYYELTGGEPKTLTTKGGTISIESGTLAVSDSNFLPSEELETNINQGKAFYVGTGGDGTYDITLRCIDGKEPSANPKEYKVVEASSKTAVISIPSGVVTVTDMGYEAANSDIQIKVEPGNYKVQIHHKIIPDSYYGYVIVICKTDEPATNSIKEIEVLD